MSAAVRFKSYRDQAELERDEARMAAKGWRLRAWRIRGQGEVAGPPEATDFPTYARLGPFGEPLAAGELLRLAVWAAASAAMFPWLVLLGRKRIDAAYERPRAASRERKPG